jgi:hypothetical protein
MYTHTHTHTHTHTYMYVYAYRKEAPRGESGCAAGMTMDQTLAALRRCHFFFEKTKKHTYMHAYTHTYVCIYLCAKKRLP